MAGRCSPYKKPRVSSPATRFAVSPVAIAKEDALYMKRTDESNVQLRYISKENIPVGNAANDSPRGFEVCVCPHNSGTNKFLQDARERQQRFDSMELYFNLLLSSVQVCATDLTSVPIYILDYHMRRLFVEKKRQAPDPKQYQSIFVGKGKKKPFKGTFGDQIRYVFLLKAWLKLNKEADSDSEETEGDKEDANESLEHFEDLLTCSEGCLVASSSYCGDQDLQISAIRKEALDFYEGGEKKGRDVGSHVFTQLFFQQRRTPLEKQCLGDAWLPPENDAVFKVEPHEAVLKIGLKVLALADIETRLSAAPSSPYKLTTSAPGLTKAAVNLVKFYIKQKGKFMESIEFHYGALKATLAVDATKPSRVIDLQSWEATGHSLDS